jgi:hypothetical protein
MRMRGSAHGGKFGLFGKIFRDRLAEVQPIGTAGLLDGLDDDAAEAERLIRRMQDDNAAFLRAKAIAMGGRIGDGDIAILPANNVIPFRGRRNTEVAG